MYHITITITVTTLSCWRNSPSTLCWIKSSRDVIQLNMCWTRRCRTFGTKIGWIMKTFDYINHVKLTLPLSFYEGTWTHSPLLVAMHLLDRSCVSIGIFLILHATFPNSGIGARSMRRWYARVEHKELWAIIVILLTTNVLLWFGGIVGWSSPDRHYMTVFMRLVLPTFFAHRWLAGFYFSNFSWIEFEYGRSLLKVKTTHLPKNRCGFDA